MIRYSHPFYATIVMAIGLFEPSACTPDQGSNVGKGDIYSDANLQHGALTTDTLSIDQGSPEGMSR